MKNKNLSYLFLALAMTIVGTSVVVGKIITTSLPIFLSSFISLLTASLLFMPTLSKRNVFSSIKKSDLFYLILQAFLGTVLYRILLFTGLKYIDASYAGILSALQPAFIALLAVAFLKEKQTSVKMIGISLAVIGLILTYSSQTFKIDLNSGLFIGTALILLSVIGEACFSVFAKKLSPKIEPVMIAGIVTVISTLMMLPLGIYDFLITGIPQITLVGGLAVVYYGVFLTYISFILWFKGLDSVKASVAGIFTALVPISGILFSALLLRDYPSTFEVIGGMLIVASILLVVYKNEK